MLIPCSKFHSRGCHEREAILVQLYKSTPKSEETLMGSNFYPETENIANLKRLFENPPGERKSTEKNSNDCLKNT